MQTEEKKLKGFIREWIDGEMQLLKKRPYQPGKTEESVFNLAGYWYVLIRSAMLEGSIEELIRTKAAAVNSFLEIGKSPEWIEEILNVTP